MMRLMSIASVELGPRGGRRLRRDAADNLARILSAAAEVFAAKGLDATLSDVAERAGVGVGTIYRRFRNKDALVTAMVAEKTAMVIAVADDAQDRATGWDSFAALVENLASLLISDRAIEELVLSEPMRPRIGETLARLEQPVTSIIRRAQREGSLRRGVTFSDLPPLLVMLISASDLISGVRQDAWRRYLLLLLEGLRADCHGSPLSVPALNATELEAAGRSAVRRRR